MTPASIKPSPGRRGRDPWSAAVAHLIGVDPRWGPLIERVGPCRLRPRRDRFGVLVRSIVSQQISTKAAASISARLLAASGTEKFEPGRLLELGEPALRACGLSGVKAGYVRNLAESVAEGRLPLSRIGAWDDEAIIERLTAIKGIGLWTAEMFLVFALNRPDILSVGDLGIRAGLRDHFGLPEPPKPKECAALAEPWRPYRTVAMWYMWRRLDTPANRA